MSEELDELEELAAKLQALRSEKPYTRVLALVGLTVRPIPSRELLEAAESLLEDSTLSLLGIPLRFGEVRSVAANAVAALREALGIAEPVVLSDVLVSMSAHEVHQRAAKAGIKTDSHGVEGTLEVLTELVRRGDVRRRTIKRLVETADSDFERQTEALARQLQHAIEHYDDPDQVAAREAGEREKEERQRAVFEEVYLKTGQRSPGDSLEVSVGKMARYLAEQLEKGEAVEVQPLPALESGEEMRLEVSGSGEERRLELCVERRDGGRAREWLMTGAVPELVALLRAAMVGEFIVVRARELARVMGR